MAASLSANVRIRRSGRDNHTESGTAENHPSEPFQTSDRGGQQRVKERPVVTVRRDREVELDIGLGLAEGARCERTSEEVACFSRQVDLKNSQANATFAYSVHKVIERRKLG